MKLAKKPSSPGIAKARIVEVALNDDAKQRRRAESALRAEEAQSRSMIENAVEGFFQTTPDGEYISANPALARMYGFSSPQDLIGGLKDIAHDLYVDPHSRERFIREIGRQGIVQGFEAQIRRRDGTVCWISENARAVRDADGTLLYYEGSVEDITPRKEAEEALRQSEARFRSAFDHAPIGMALVSLSGRWLKVNKKVCEILGFSEKELLSLDVATITHAEDLDKEAEFWQQLLGGKLRSCQWEKRFYDRQTDPVWVLSSASLVRDGAGEPIYFVVQIQNITETKRLEQQLHQAQKMEAVGRLAGGVAHDFNNMLTVIGGFSDLVYNALGRAHPLLSHVDQIRKASERATGLTKQLLAFSRRQVIKPQVIDLNAVVTDMQGMMRRLLTEDLDFNTRCGDNLGWIKADRGQVEQILLNLAVNARDAMPRGGMLTIETANATLTEAYVRRCVDVQPGPYVLLAVSDTGCGMDEAVKARLFEPFFTTKEKGKGTGLGLATVYGIVKQAGGHIAVYSEPGHGAVFKIYLPRVDEKGVQLSSVQEPQPLPRGSETILVVEDEEGVRELARSVLLSAGYTVLEAANGKDAAELCEVHPNPINLVLTDVVMPQMGGRELADRLAKQGQHNVLFMSGYMDDAIVLHGVLEEGVPFLQKPFTAETLAIKVHEVLRATRAIG